MNDPRSIKPTEITAPATSVDKRLTDVERKQVKQGLWIEALKRHVEALTRALELKG